MTRRILLLAGAALLPAACSSGSERGGAGSNGAGSDRGDAGMLAADAAADDDTLVVPPGLSIAALPGGNGVLDLIALTLLKGSNSTELYVALRNDDANILACDPGISIDLYDKSSQPMGTWIGGLNTKHFYRLPDAGAVASCVGPGDVTMAALTDLPSDLVIDDVGYVVYRCPYFAMNALPIDGLTISQVEGATVDGGTVYTGTLVNGFDAAVRSPAVQVFPVNGVGRPLGIATASGTNDIPAGASWQFRTNAVESSAIDYFAYPMATLVY